MLLRLMRLTAKITGALLGSLVVSLLAGNIPVCILSLVLGLVTVANNLNYQAV